MLGDPQPSTGWSWQVLGSAASPSLGSWRQILLCLRLRPRQLQARPWALQSFPLLSVPSWPVPAGFDISTLVCRRRELDFAGSHPGEEPHLILQL